MKISVISLASLFCIVSSSDQWTDHVSPIAVESDHVIRTAPEDVEYRGAKDEGLPSFQWDSDHTSEDGTPYLRISFPDSGEDDFAILVKQNIMPPFPNEETEEEEEEEFCNLGGTLQGEPNAKVYLNGCPDQYNFSIILHSRRLINKFFIVENGEVSVYIPDGVMRPPQFNTTTETERNWMDEGYDISLGSKVNRALNERAIPSGTRFRLRVSINYDTNFVSAFGSGYRQRMGGVLNFARSFFNFDSLGATMEISVVEEKTLSFSVLVNQNTISTSQSRCYNTARNSNVNANIYVCMSYDPTSGIIGVAYDIGSVCSSDRGARSAIVEYYGNDFNGAANFAHEIGHLLGLYHDFVDGTYDPSDCSRTSWSYNGVLCAGSNSIMDYCQSYWDKWSPCSEYWLNQYYDNVVSETGGFCLQTISGCNPNPDQSPHCDYWINTVGYDCNGYYKAYFEDNCATTCQFC